MVKRADPPLKYVALGKRIERARIIMGITQTDLAKRVGVKKATPSYWEKGKYRPSQLHLQRLSEVLFVSLDSLIQGVKILNEDAVITADGELVDIKKLPPDQAVILKAAIGKKNAEVWRLNTDSVLEDYRPGRYLVVEIGETAAPGKVVLARSYGTPIFRKYLDPFLFMTKGGTNPTIRVDRVNTIIVGTVIFDMVIPS